MFEIKGNADQCDNAISLNVMQIQAHFSYGIPKEEPSEENFP